MDRRRLGRIVQLVVAEFGQRIGDIPTSNATSEWRRHKIGPLAIAGLGDEDHDVVGVLDAVQVLGDVGARRVPAEVTLRTRSADTTSGAQVVAFERLGQERSEVEVGGPGAGREHGDHRPGGVGPVVVDGSVEPLHHGACDVQQRPWMLEHDRAEIVRRRSA